MIGIVFGVLYVTRGNIKSNLISKINAQNIALGDAKIDLSSVDYINTELDFEHGNYIYDIEFSVNGIEYEYLIKAKDGSIIKTEIENEKINNYNVMSIDKVKDIILNDSNLNSNDVTFVKEKLDTDDGAYVYDINFYMIVVILFYLFLVVLFYISYIWQISVFFIIVQTISYHELVLYFKAYIVCIYINNSSWWFW